MANPPRMLEAFRDPAVPDGAETMGDDWQDTDKVAGGGGGGEVPPASPLYRAVCDDPKHENGWFGYSRDSWDAAQGDADRHIAENPGHAAEVRS
jgi:hypothetical protein